MPKVHDALQLMVEEIADRLACSTDRSVAILGAFLAAEGAGPELLQHLETLARGLNWLEPGAPLTPSREESRVVGDTYREYFGKLPVADLLRRKA